jgi:FtsZ-interacting cell division protein ZipA
MIKMILLIWATLASICVILMGLWEAGKLIIKKLFKAKPPKKSRPEDDDNSWLNNQHFDPH